jgi:hypothetical protein
MTDPWLTYTQAAEQLGVSRQAVRQKATRGRWPRLRGNDGQARVQVPEQPYRDRTATIPTAAVPPVPADVQLVRALESHIASLKAEIERLTAERQADQDRHQDELTAARAAADKATVELVELARRMAALAETKAEPEPRRRGVWGWFLRN